MEVVRVLRRDGVDEVLVPFEQFEYFVFLVQGVELFLGHLLELLDDTSSCWYWPALLV